MNHVMDCTSDNGTERLFECPVEGCGRRQVLRRNGELLVLDRGDRGVTHSGSAGMVPLEIGPLTINQT